MNDSPMWPLRRRQWLQAAAASGAAAPLLSARAGAVLPEAGPAMRAVFDRRLPGGSAFAANAGALGLPSRGFEGDVTALWFGDLAAALAGPRETWLMGHTALQPLDCLEQMAADVRHAVVLRVEHRPIPGGTEHHLSAPPATLAGLRGWLEGAADWRTGLASALLAAAGTGVAGRQIHAKSRTTGTFGGTVGGAASVSWLIAPTRRA